MVIWREDRITCKEVVKSEFTISYLFKNYSGGLVWVLLGCIVMVPGMRGAIVERTGGV